MILLIVILVCLCALYLFLIAPKVPARDIGKLPGLYAHRGLWNEERPENSLPAFKAAVEKGFGIELDVHLTADGRLAVFHDDSLKRMCGDDRRVSDCTLAQLKALRLKGTEETIPSFEEFLSLVSGAVPLIVEIKTCKKITELCEKVNEALRSYPGLYCVESFDPRAVRWYRKHRPDVIRGQLTFGLVKPSMLPKNTITRLLASQMTNVLGRPDFIAFDHTTCNTFPQRLVRLFHPHYAAWTIRSREDLERLKKGCKMLIFESFMPENPDKGA